MGRLVPAGTGKKEFWDLNVKAVENY
jgi:hypothetical protein